MKRPKPFDYLAFQDEISRCRTSEDFTAMFDKIEALPEDLPARQDLFDSLAFYEANFESFQDERTEG